MSTPPPKPPLITQLKLAAGLVPASESALDDPGAGGLAPNAARAAMLFSVWFAFLAPIAMVFYLR